MILGLQSDIAPELTLAQRIAHGGMSYLFYTAKTLWPVSLSGFYPHPYLARSGGVPWTSMEVALGCVALAGISALAWRERARRPHLLVGWLWFTGTLAPVLGLIQVGKQGYADRYSYFPQIGLFLALAFELGRWLRARPDPQRATRRAAPVVAALLAALGALSHAQAGTWRNSEALFAHGVALDPRNAVFHYNLARQLQVAGRGDEAIPHYRAVLGVDAEHTKAMNNLATLLDARGDSAGARELFERALVIAPDAAELHYNFGNHLSRHAERADAIREYRRALALDAGLLRARINLGHVLRDLGRLGAARAQYEKVLAIEPANAAAKRALDALP
jgi:tetratricopeptide (TPR) repeat protein